MNDSFFNLKHQVSIETPAVSLPFCPEPVLAKSTFFVHNYSPWKLRIYAHAARICLLESHRLDQLELHQREGVACTKRSCFNPLLMSVPSLSWLQRPFSQENQSRKTATVSFRTDRRQSHPPLHTAAGSQRVLPGARGVPAPRVAARARQRPL